MTKKLDYNKFQRTDVKEREHVTGTIGMMVSHPAFNVPKLVNCDAYKTPEGYELHACSGQNGSRIRKIETVYLSNDQWENRSYDPYNDIDKFDWFMNQIGCNQSDNH